MIDMKRVECASASCGSRRGLQESPADPQGVQAFWVPEGQQGPFYCSTECSLYGRLEQPTETPLGEGSPDGGD